MNVLSEPHDILFVFCHLRFGFIAYLLSALEFTPENYSLDLLPGILCFSRRIGYSAVTHLHSKLPILPQNQPKTLIPSSKNQIFQKFLTYFPKTSYERRATRNGYIFVSNVQVALIIEALLF